MIDINKKIMEAMKAHDKVASETFKLVKAKILEFKTAKNAKEYDDAAEINLIRKMIQERQDSACIYLKNNRQDLADDEYAQIKVLDTLLPPLPTKNDVELFINKNYPHGIEKSQMGIAIKTIKANLIGVDGKMVADCVKNAIYVEPTEIEPYNEMSEMKKKRNEKII